MAGEYCTKVNAAAISGVVESDIADYQVTSVNQYVELLLGRNFGVANSHTQYFDIEGDEKGLQLMHWPIIAITRLRDNQRESSYTDMVEDTDFTVDKQAGLIRLIQDEFNILKGSSGFTKGIKTVAITYTWGYASVPEPISLFADWLLAWIAEIKKVTGAAKTADGNLLRRVHIGDYEEAYDTNNTTVNSKYKGILADMTSMLVGKYKFWGETDGDYFTSI